MLIFVYVYLNNFNIWIFPFSTSSHIDDNKLRYIDVLKTAVAIQSVSAWPEKRGEIQRMVEWTADKLKALGTEIELVDIGVEHLPSGKTIPLPNVLFGALGKVSRYLEIF